MLGWFARFSISKMDNTVAFFSFTFQGKKTHISLLTTLRYKLLLPCACDKFTILKKNLKIILKQCITMNKTENAVSASRRRVRLTILTKNSVSGD